MVIKAWKGVGENALLGVICQRVWEMCHDGTN